MVYYDVLVILLGLTTRRNLQGSNYIEIKNCENNNEIVPDIVKDCLSVRVLMQESVEDKFIVAVHWLNEHQHKD